MPADSPALPSERTFGLTMAGACAVAAAVAWWRGRPLPPAFWLVPVVLVLLAVVQPRLLTPFNVAWARLGALLHRVVSPLVLGVVFFGVMTPYALWLRLRGRDALSRRINPNASTYWITRTDTLDPTSLRRQF